MRDRNFKRVGEWWFGGDGEKAEELFHTNPAKFYRLMGWADADAEAEPIQIQVAQKKAKDGKTHKDAVDKSIKSPRRALSSPAPVPCDPADDAGAAFVS